MLQDAMGVLTRTMQHASAALGDPRGRVRNRLRSVGRRVLIIGRQVRLPEPRCRWIGADGTARWVGLGVIANDL